MHIVGGEFAHDNVMYELGYKRLGFPIQIFSFSCDESGKPLLDEMSADTRRLYEQCRAGIVDERPVVFMGIRKIALPVNDPVGRCDCGQLVVLHSKVNKCARCGGVYGRDGGLVASP